ncbi:hypothetical protein M413DRAFT_12580 [Hebeloma cylindrosporum]|uniref:Uncharacterized protein n=1 Tax=Hebeloma cylindrosporum TaxID=76867 RepID=A0A0C3C305_HEBCY|nr:hypothetical protein M413DRAFT_12580 [Hebeloma cylindrosporum h7]
MYNDNDPSSPDYEPPMSTKEFLIFFFSIVFGLTFLIMSVPLACLWIFEQCSKRRSRILLRQIEVEDGSDGPVNNADELPPYTQAEGAVLPLPRQPPPPPPVVLRDANTRLFPVYYCTDGSET